MLRVVFDTNVVISGLLWSGSPRQVLQLAADQHADAVTSEALIDELRDVLKRDKLQKYLRRLQKTPEDLITDYLRYSRVIEPDLALHHSIRDPEDAKVLAAAVGGKANFIVSGDEDLLILKQYRGITIVNVREFVQHITADNSTSS